MTSVPQQLGKPSHAVFYTDATDYVYPKASCTFDPQGQNCYLPLEVDTEFWHPPTVFKHSPENLSPTITVQARAISIDKGLIFAHPDIRQVARHFICESEFIGVDYLRALGYDVQIFRETGDFNDLPWIQIDLYACFAVAELLRVVQGDLRQDIIELCSKGETKNQGIVQGRRLRTFTKIRGQYLPWVEILWVLRLNGHFYRVRLCWQDTAAVHGGTGYADFCHNTGTPIPYKDTFKPDEKARMLDMYRGRPEDFDNYALGDLYNHLALINYAELVARIRKALGLPTDDTLPRLTTGATVRDLIEAIIGHSCRDIHPGISYRMISNAYCQKGSASELKKRLNTTACYNAKVDGGRCRNNRPTDTVLYGALADIDISGCYAEGLRGQLYPLGVPVIIEYPLNSAYNEYPTLRKFLVDHRHELVPGLWHLRVSLREGYRLKYAQDVLTSWFPPKNLALLPTDTDSEATDEWWSENNVGVQKTLSKQVHLAIVNHDVLQWIENIASARQRKELLDNLYVVTGMFYPASERVNSIEELRYAHDTHKGKNTCTIKKIRGVTTKISIEQECHKWFGFTLGDAFVTRLLQERRLYPKDDPLNALYKLFINTTYGDLVSPYFTIGNVVVGNNITARARMMAWYIEKGLHGFETITDGCAFDLNRVLYPGNVRVNGETVVGVYRQISRDINLDVRPLGDVSYIEIVPDAEGKAGLKLTRRCTQLYGETLSDCKNCDKTRISSDASNNCITVLDAKHALEWINQTALEHLQKLFLQVDVLHKLTENINGNKRVGIYHFETKGVYDTGVFHGSANYMFMRWGNVEEVKMRSYSRQPVEYVTGSELDISKENNLPAYDFLQGLLQNPSAVARQKVFVKSGILKLGDFSRHYERKYRDSKVFPGMSVKSASLLREFSLAQFTYQDIEQFRAWERESENLRRHYGQSYEMYFLNGDNTLDYQLMVSTIDRLISEGKHGFWDGRSKRSSNGYRLQTQHPAFETLNMLRSSLNRYYSLSGTVDDDAIDVEFTVLEDITERSVQEE